MEGLGIAWMDGWIGWKGYGYYTMKIVESKRELVLRMQGGKRLGQIRADQNRSEEQVAHSREIQGM